MTEIIYGWGILVGSIAIVTDKSKIEQFVLGKY